MTNMKSFIRNSGKRTLKTATLKAVLVATVVCVWNLSTVMAQDIKLQKPETGGGIPLYEALKNRQTNRTFSDKMLSDQDLTNLLWCANGINREENGKRTAPSARNAQEIDVYVCMKEGVYLYEPKENVLKRVSGDDLRPVLTSRGSDMIMSAPLTLLFVANYEKMKGFDEAGKEFYGATDAAYVSQNVYLFCAANNIHTVVMGSIDRPSIAQKLNLNGKAVLAQPVGYADR